MRSGQDVFPRNADMVGGCYKAAQGWLAVQQQFMQDPHVILLNDVPHHASNLIGYRMMAPTKRILFVGPQPDICREIFLGSWHLIAYQYIQHYAAEAGQNSYAIFVPRPRIGETLYPFTVDPIGTAVEKQIRVLLDCATDALVMYWDLDGVEKASVPPRLRLAAHLPKAVSVSENSNFSDVEHRFKDVKRGCAKLFGIDLPDDTDDIPY